MNLHLVPSYVSPGGDPSFPPTGLLWLFWILFITLLTGVGIIQFHTEKKSSSVPVRKKIIRALVTAVAFFIFLEGFLHLGAIFIKDDRAFHRQPAYWTLKPGHITRRDGILYQSNSLGLRGPEIPPKEKDEFRILCIGDSWTAGQGVAYEDAYPAVLEQLLNKKLPERRITVVNGGMFGYSILQGYYLFTDIQPTVKADLLITGGFNRVAQSQLDLYQAELEKNIKPRLSDRIKSSFLTYLCIRRSVIILQSNGAGPRPQKATDEQLNRIRIRYRELLADKCREQEIPIIMFDHVSLPFCRRALEKHQDGTLSFPYKKTNSGFYLEIPDDEIPPGEYPHSRIGSVDFYAICPDSNDDFFLPGDPTHPSEKGHRAMAEILCEIIAPRLSPPPADPGNIR